MSHPANGYSGLEVNGTTDVSVRAPDGTSYDDEYLDRTVTSDRNVNVTLTAQQTATVSGTVTNPDGTPASNVTLRWEGIGGTSGFAEVLTDADGSFSAQVDATGDYHVTYWQGDTQAGNVTFPRDGVADFGNLGRVGVPGDTTADFTLLSGRSLNVTVENESGVGLADASVAVSDEDPTTEERSYVYGYRDGGVPTDAQGRMAHPDNPAPGIEVNGTTPVYVRPPAGTDYGDNYTEYDVQAPRDETVVLHETATVSGTVTNPDGTPAANVTLDWEDVNDAADDRRALTDAEGRFSVQLRDATDYRVSYWQGDIRAGNVTYPRDGVADFGNLGPVSVSGDATTNYTLLAGSALNVTVENATGEPVTAAEVEVSDTHPETDEKTSFYGYRSGDVPVDERGRMAHPDNHAPGVEVNGTTTVYVEEPAGTDYGSNYTEFDVQAPRDETLHLYRTTTVSGTVTNPDGTPAENVTLRWWTDQNGHDFEEVVTDADGTYTAQVRENHDYEVTTWQADLSDVDASEPANVAYPRDGVADFAALGWHNTTTTADTRDFTLPVGHALNVTVENATGAPVENASVQLVDRGGGIWTSAYHYLHEDGLPTDAQGRMYHPPNSEVGLEVNDSIDVTARPPSASPYEPEATEVTLTADRDVTLTVDRPTRLDGQWVAPDGSPVDDATVHVINFSTGVFETIETTATGNFSTAVPDGTYGVWVTEETPGNGVADAWMRESVAVDGPTDLGTLTVPRGYQTTLYVEDRDGGSVDAYADVRGGNGGWIYTYGHGRALDRPSGYDARSPDLTNGSHETTVYDSWTHDVLDAGFVTVAGSDRTVTRTVDRFNGTRVSGAVGTAVVRDLQTPTDDQTVQDVLDEESTPDCSC
ncbi:hypothetical protein [Halorussus caseinilyticus]|uniref:Carboxypeptidase regulatory-like domain-containing protein n=1 Tax=Halorussus caseinilyticus TaxID=3034025 RepID=A0ABD5WI72_9EURY